MEVKASARRSDQQKCVNLQSRVASRASVVSRLSTSRKRFMRFDRSVQRVERENRPSLVGGSLLRAPGGFSLVTHPFPHPAEPSRATQLRAFSEKLRCEGAA